MPLRGLLHSTEPGRICDIVEAGNEFEVHSDFQWVDIPDGATTADTYNEDGTITKFDITQVEGFAEHGYRVARQIAYSAIGDQMDMLFKELQATGTISNSGPWATHVASVKEAIPKDDPQAVQAWNVAYWEALQASLQGNV
jgi:hypothetical protein